MYKLIILFGLLSFVGCSKPNTNSSIQAEYTVTDLLGIPVTDSTGQETVTIDKLEVYTELTYNNEPIQMASCKGCHFVCPHCVPEEYIPEE